MIKNFDIPLNKDELLKPRASLYSVQNIIPIQMVQQALEVSKAALQADRAKFILNHFDTFFSVLVHGNKLELPVVLRSFNRIIKGIEMLIRDMEKLFNQNKEIEEEERPALLCVNKMLAYLISQFICHIDKRVINTNTSQDIGKRKKNNKSDVEEEWEIERQKALEFIYQWVQLPIHKLWKPPIVEDSFISVLAQVCYKILEHSKAAKQKTTRLTIFEILGTFVKKYNHGLICVVKIVQLVKLYDTLAAVLAAGVVHMDVEYGCNGFIKQAIKEINQTEPTEAESRNVSIFLESIANAKPDIMLPILDDILELLVHEHYTMRNCAVGIIGAIIPKVLTGEDLTVEQKTQRDDCFNNLEEHILDINAYVRSKVLQVSQSLCSEGAIPLSRQVKLLSISARRLQDKSANVRKQALQLLRALLQSNPFTAKLHRAELSKSLELERLKLKELQTQFASESARGDTERLELWNKLLPDIREALKKVTEDDDKENTSFTEEMNEEQIDPNNAFEKVRQFLLVEQVSDAVSYLWKVCLKLKDVAELENFTAEMKEECLFLFLLKIFMESEADITDEEKKQNSDRYKKQKVELKARKRLVDYLDNCVKFATVLEDVIPLVEKLLFSTIAGDAVEACTLLGTAYQFGISGAEVAFRKALFQIFHKDESVRRNVSMVYKEIYLTNAELQQKTEKQKAISCVKNLIQLITLLEGEQNSALTELITTWYKNEELNEETLQILWMKFSMKSPDTTILESRAALILITMIAQVEPKIITSNLGVLIKIGFGPKAKTDLLLARDTCRLLLKIKNDSEDIEHRLIRYSNDHEMFQKILTLLIDTFNNTENDGYISFATDAINAVYELANQPDNLMKSLLLNVSQDFIDKNDKSNSAKDAVVLSKLLHLVGHIAIRQMVHLDTSVYKEFKRRNIVRKMQKNKKHNISNSHQKSLVISSASDSVNRTRNKEQSTVMEDDGEEAMEGAADDADAEFIHTILENEIVTGVGLLTKFVPLVVDICKHPDKYTDEKLQAASSLSLCKMMTVSSVFCETYLQLLVTILEKSLYPGIRSNLLIGLSDLIIRFPNQVEPWTKHIYGRLRDEDTNVRRTCVRVLSNLIMREMIRVKGQVSELALCIIDKDTQIQQETKQLFKELSQKGNALYNVIPDILSRLIDPELNLDKKCFQKVLSYILGLIQKEKQVDTIVEKICAKFKFATTERQWCDLSYCLTLLQFSSKSIRRLTESLPLLKDKIHHESVLKALELIIEQTKKKPEAKAACTELEEKINELLENVKDVEMENEEITSRPSIHKNKPFRKNRRKSIDENTTDDSDSDSNSATPHVINERKKSQLLRRIIESTNTTPVPATKKNRSSKIASVKRSSARLASRTPRT